MYPLRCAILAVSVAVVSCGCRSIGDRDDPPEVGRLVHERTSFSGKAASHWERSGIPWDEDGLLASEDAVGFALIHNPGIAAELARVRESNAELAQAGLLPNPRLGLSLGIDTGGGVGTFSVSLMQTLSALWLRPAREAAADARLRETIFQAAHASFTFIAEVKSLHRRIVHLQESLLLIEEEERLLEKMVQTARARLETGLGDAVEVSRHQAEHRAVQMTRARVRRDLGDLQRDFLVMMGIPEGDTRWRAAAVEPGGDLSLLTEAEALAAGLEARLDVRAAEWAVLAAEEDTVLVRRQELPEVDAGLGFERDLDKRTIGPALGVEVPLFDRGHARREAAGARLDRHRLHYEATRQQAIREIRQSWSGVRYSAEQLEYRKAALSHAEAALVQVQAAFATGDAGRLDIQGAERDLLEARRNLEESLLQHDLALIGYRQALGWASTTFPPTP